MHFFELALFACIAIQVLYLMIYLVAFLHGKVSQTGKPVSVSVIVCAHDEEQNLKELIPLLLQQEHADFEIIVVEDRSNDESFDYLYALAKQNTRLRMVPVKSKPDHINGKKFALTLGIKAAKYDWVLLTDADCRPASNQWINEMCAQFSDDKAIVLGYSPYEKTKGFLNSFIRFEALLTGIQCIGLALLGKPYMGVGRNLAYRKKLFLDNKGFNSHLSVMGGDDDLFINEVGTKENTTFVLGHASLVYSKAKTTWEEFYIQKIRHLSVGKHYRLSNKIYLGLFNASWIGTWLLIIPALIYSTLIYVPIVAFVLRMVLLITLVHVASRKLGDGFSAWKAMFLDFNFAIYYLVTGLVALQTNKVRWKKT